MKGKTNTKCLVRCWATTNHQMIHTVFILLKPISELSCPVHGAGVILEETEMFHYRIKLIGQKNFVNDLQDLNHATKIFLKV